MNAQKTKKWLKNNVTIRMGIIGLLILILLIPLSYVKELIRERKQLQSEVISEINRSWGDEIILLGPVLEIPYKTYSEKKITDEKTKKTQIIKEVVTKYAYFFPETLNIKGIINTEKKHLGMYTTSVYNTKAQINGKFSKLNLKYFDVNEKDMLWNKAKIIMQTSNLKGIKKTLMIHLNDSIFEFEASFSDSNKNTYYDKNGEIMFLNKHTVSTSTFNYKTVAAKNKTTNFSIDFNVSGSSRFKIIPIGKTTEMQITSNWENPGFEGEYLPYNPNKQTVNGFDAKWKVLQMNRPFPQQFKSIPDLNTYAFGVNFFIPVDDYQQSVRTAKYGYLMISLTFLLFFLIQTISKIYIHPFQYLMIGLALIIFYTLLISISEHSSFNISYLIAGSSVIGLITLYAKSIMKSWKFSIFIGFSLFALYSFIFIIIQLENYALLVGSIGLFIILSLVMYTSRKIEWQ